MLLDEYLKFDSISSKESRFSRNLLGALRTVKRRAIIYWVIIVGNGVLYILKALLSPGRIPMEAIQILYSKRFYFSF